MPDQVASEV